MEITIINDFLRSHIQINNRVWNQYSTFGFKSGFLQFELKFE
jgi:hypothetical protein